MNIRVPSIWQRGHGPPRSSAPDRLSTSPLPPTLLIISSGESKVGLLLTQAVSK